MKKILIIVVVLAIIGGIYWMLNRDSASPVGQQTANLDMVDTVGTFYSQWLKAAQDPSVKPTKVSLTKSPLLSMSLRNRIVSALENPSTVIDPVLCMTAVPEAIVTRKVYENTDKAEALVNSKDKKVTEEAVVGLKKQNDMWLIDEIKCSGGEFAPEKEFTFEGTGFLLKGSIPPPYSSKNWHLIYEENGTAGNVVPLIFDSKSQCTSLDGNKAVCKPDQFKETNKVSIKGQMTERGASVQSLVFVE
jgi:hypothetical protein